VQHCEIDRALDIKRKVPVGEHALQHVAASRFRPQPAKHQIRSNVETMQFGQFAAIKARQYDRTARMARRRGDQSIEQTRGFDLVAPPQRLDDALHMATALARVLDEVEVFVGSNLLDADKHGAAPGTSTTILCIPASRILTSY